jgi:hypothetical protein
MIRWLIPLLGIVWFGLCPGASPAAEPPRVLELGTQKVDGTTYFQVRLERPADLGMPAFDTGKPFSDADRRKFARLPRLVPQDGKTWAVYYRHRPTQPGLSFCGQLTGGGRARFLLLYPLPEAASPKDLPLADLVRSPGMAEVGVEVDFDKARMVPVPKANADDQYIHHNDLRSLWALHQAANFAVLETQVLDFNFYSFAREATGRKYGVMAPAWVKRQVDDPEHRLYEITTGADALAETLQLHRLLQPNGKSEKPRAERSVDLSEVRGVKVPEQPWGQLLEGKKPEVEPLARLVPADNYYVHFKSIRKFLEFGDLLDLWGTSVLRVYEMKSRDCRLRQRYERQLCLKSTALGKVLGPAVVKSVAVTGSDPFVREGTDVAILFQVANRPLFLAVVEKFLEEARKEHGDGLREGRDDYHGTTIEHFVTPLREVSLHRAVVGDFVIYANSAAGIRRVLDARREGSRCLADADDFRYLRTIFPPNDEAEDGLVYLSDAFLRQLTGPASRIKERRRVEALTSLYMVTNAALFCAWETGKLPAGHEAALAGAGLRPEDVAVPEGKGVRWDAERRLAVSDVYNTLHFATPLIELPIDRVTPAEAKAYDDFRQEYEKLWRTYYDPIGLRFSFDNRRVRVETHILPLAASGQYRTLLALGGQGTFRFEPRREAVVDFGLSVGDLPIGLQLDENPFLRRMVEVLIRWEADARTNLRQEYDRMFWKLRLGVSLQGKEDQGEAGVAEIVNLIRIIAGDEPAVRKHKGVAIHRVPISGEKYRQAVDSLERLSKQLDLPPLTTLLALLPRQEAPPALHVAAVGRTVLISADEGSIKKRIDQAEQRKKGGGAKPPESDRESNAALFISPANARAAASLFLEHEGHSLALLNNSVWDCFYQAGLLAPDAADSVRQQTARHFLGFVPVSPDGSPYRYDARRGEVVSERHGSQRRPDWHDQVAPTSEPGKFLEQIQSLRAELRFLDNGLHTTVTIERRPAP